MLRCLMMIPFLLAACATDAGKAVGTDAVDQSYTVAGGRFDTGSSIIMAVVPRDFGGRLALCGASFQDKSNLPVIGSEARVVAATSVTVNGDTVMRDLNPFEVLPLRQNVSGQPTRCFLTGEAWPGGTPEVVIRMPSFQTRSDRNKTVSFTPEENVPDIISPQPVSPAPETPKPGQWQRRS